MNYQKTYMNHIHSSSLLCQLAVMWKSQTLCDAIIRTGNITTKAHRVVLVAACPMLQSMENAAAGSHLEVRLAADIKQDSINSFLQYLYEGFITLTEENCKDVEKIARLLQVENVIKCCADFSKCLNSSSATQYKYTFSDQLEFRHMRTTDLSKVQERMHKRHLDTFRPSSPGSKRQRIIRPSSPHSDVSMHGATHKLHDTTSMAESYMSGAPDPMDRVPRLGSGIHPSSATAPTPSRSTSTTSLQPGVVNIVEDCIELIQTEPPGKHPGDGHPPEPRKVQSSVSISVASQHNAKTDLQIVNVTGTNESSDKTSAASDVIPISIPGSPSSSSSSSFKESSNIAHERHAAMNTSQQTSSQQKSDVDRGTINLTDVPFTSESDLMSGVKPRGADNFATSTPQRAPFPVSMSAVPRGQSQMFQSKQVPFAAGSATQAETGRGQRSQSLGSTGRLDPIERSSPAATTVTQVKDTSVKTKTESSSDMTPDISIVKVEGVNEGNSDYPGGLDMFVSEAGVTSQPRLGGDDDDPSDFELEEPPGDMSREEQMSNEGGNFTGDQSGNWYMGSFRDVDPFGNYYQQTGSDYPTEYVKRYRYGQEVRRMDAVQAMAMSSATIQRQKMKPGPKPSRVGLKFYLLPAGCHLPKLSREDPLIETHHSQGYGYPEMYYENGKARWCPIPLYLSEEEFKDKIRSLYRNLEGKDFYLFTMDNNRKVSAAPCSPLHFKRSKYKGTVIIRIKNERPDLPEHTHSDNSESTRISDDRQSSPVPHEPMQSPKKEEGIEFLGSNMEPNLT